MGTDDFRHSTMFRNSLQFHSVLTYQSPSECQVFFMSICASVGLSFILFTAHETDDRENRMKSPRWLVIVTRDGRDHFLFSRFILRLDRENGYILMMHRSVQKRINAQARQEHLWIFFSFNLNSRRN